MSKIDALTRFLDAMHNKDLDQLKADLAEDATLRSPIVPEPFVGKVKCFEVLGYLLRVVDDFTVREILPGHKLFAVFLEIRLDDIRIDAVDMMGLNEKELINEMMIMWRPLPAVVAVQNRIAPLLGLPAISLVPQT